jgi:endonuclease YncB( thermonuclease family)
MNMCNRSAGRLIPARAGVKLLALLMALLMTACLFSCDSNGKKPGPHVDYVADTKLDMTSSTRKIEAEVKSYIDGDTTHFYVEKSADFPEGVVKARYLAIDTPESTGRLEEWGKTAAAFTKEKLKSAAAIMLESDTETWNMDSNERHLLWIWYKPTADADWRNLNIEILQSGFAVASNSGQNRYGTTCMAALSQAKAEELYVHSDEKDPTFPYGAAVEITIRELRINRDAYEGQKVAIEGVITQGGTTIYVEQYDEEDGRTYGVQVYLGHTPPAGTSRFLKAGNRVRIVGSFQYAEVVNAYQIAGIVYDPMKPGDPTNTYLIETALPITHKEITDLSDFVTGKTEMTVGDEKVSFDNSELALYTPVSIKGLTVVDTWTTQTGDNAGAISLTCEKDGVRITIRTIKLYENGEMVTADRFEGKTIDVKGLVDSYTPEGSTEAQKQIKVFALADIIIH